MLLQSLIRFVATVLVIFLRYTCQALDNGLALTPPLGISTWSIFRGNINHTLVVDLADSMVRLGLRDAGFEYLMVDAGWSTSNKGCKYCLPNRDEAGNLLVDSVKFPNLTSTIDQVHSKGLLFGIWFGVEMCADTNDGQQGTTNTNVIDYAEIDAQFFASIGVDAIKHDNCNSYVANTTKGITGNFDKYQRMSRALNRTGRPILYDVTLQVSKERTLPAYDYNYIWSPERKTLFLQYIYYILRNGSIFLSFLSLTYCSLRKRECSTNLQHVVVCTCEQVQLLPLLCSS